MPKVIEMPNIRIVERAMVSFSDAQRIAPAHEGTLPTLREFLVALRSDFKYGELEGSYYWLADTPAHGLLARSCRANFGMGRLDDVLPAVHAMLPERQKMFVADTSSPVAIGVSYAALPGSAEHGHMVGGLNITGVEVARVAVVIGSATVGADASERPSKVVSLDEFRDARRGE